MNGRRTTLEPHKLEPGDYCKYQDKWWYCRPPGTSKAFLGNISGHKIIEHDDGTITVSPSILIKCHEGEWHGYLENGIWRKC